jgi:hypothetical protein
LLRGHNGLRFSKPDEKAAYETPQFSTSFHHGPFDRRLRIREEARCRHRRLEQREGFDAIESRHESAGLFFEHARSERADWHNGSHTEEHNAVAATEPTTGHGSLSNEAADRRRAQATNKPRRKPACGGDSGRLCGGPRVGAGRSGGGGLSCGG